MDPFHSPRGSMSCIVLEVITERGKVQPEGVFDTASVSHKRNTHTHTHALAHFSTRNPSRYITVYSKNNREVNQMRWKSKTY